MAKIDEVKEILNSLRLWLSLTIGLIVVMLITFKILYHTKKIKDL